MFEGQGLEATDSVISPHAGLASSAIKTLIIDSIPRTNTSLSVNGLADRYRYFLP